MCGKSYVNSQENQFEGRKVVIFNHRQQCSEFSSICVKTGPGQKLRNLGNPWNLRNFFPGIFKSEFLILAVGQNRKLGKKKTRNNFSEISEISDFSEFSIRHFFIFFLTFLKIFYKCFSKSLFYLCNYSPTLSFINKFDYLIISLTKHDFLCLCFRL